MKNFLKHTLTTFALVFAAATHAQTFPVKPIKIIVPFAPGGSNDILSRVLGAKLSTRLGQSVVIENRAGGGGTLGTEFVAKSAPDGYTMIVGNAGSHGVNAGIYTKLNYDVVKDFVPVALICTTPNVMVVNPSVKVKTMAEFLAYAKANPGRLNYASPGVGTPHHLSMELFKNTAQVFLTHIPYRGTAPAVTDLLGGQVDAMFLPIHVALPQIKAGKLVALGIGSDQRHPLLPNVPTLSEAKAGKVNVDMWYGIFAPKNTPNDIVQAFNREIKTILASEDVQKAFQPQGMDPANSTPEEFGKLVERDANRWAELIKIQNIKAE